MWGGDRGEEGEEEGDGSGWGWAFGLRGRGKRFGRRLGSRR